MESFKPLIAKVAAGATLTRSEAESAFDAMLSGEVTPSQMGGFLMALRVRGETVDEITGAVAAMLKKFPIPQRLRDVGFDAAKVEFVAGEIAAAAITGTTHFAGARWVPHWSPTRACARRLTRISRIPRSASSASRPRPLRRLARTGRWRRSRRPLGCRAYPSFEACRRWT